MGIGESGGDRGRVVAGWGWGEEASNSLAR